MFVEARTRVVLAEVSRLLGFRNDGAELLRHHSNAVYALDDKVVKIAPPQYDMDRMRSVVSTVQWLTARRFPTVPLYPGLDQPLYVDGHAVTVWQRLDAAPDCPVTAAELGELLRELHALPTPPVELRSPTPVESIRKSIGISPILDEADQALLLAILGPLAKAWSVMDFPFGTSLIHSDPQTRNALRRFDGSAVLADWDSVARGPREWDIATIAVHCRRFTAQSLTFTDFLTAYGWDARTWSGFEGLCQLRELQMIATNARKSHPGTAAAAEVHRRVAGVRRGNDDLAWQIL